MRETEITVELVDGAQNFIELMQKHGFELTETCRLTDYYYSKYSLNELLEFSYEDLIRNSFLVRHASGNHEQYQLVYKDKTLDKDGNVISEEKVKCDVTSLESVLKIFDLTKLTCWCYMPQSLSFYKKGEVEFILQEVDGLGVFLEFEETASMQHLTEQQKIDKMLEYLKELGLNFGKDYSCKKVYLKFLKDNNRN